jgi:GTP cyclohydrolase I
MGLNLEDDSLIDTPKRMAKMYINEIFYGLNYDNFPKATKVENKFKYDEMVLERNIVVNSTCEHHLLPIVGSAFVAYIPTKPVVGLSKLNRIVDFFARRPQVQERLTAQISEALKFLLQTEDVAVVIEAEHLCVKTRGVIDPCSDTITSSLSGKFRDPAMRAEFFALAKGLR